jgi:hypothetical protein
MNRRNRTLIVLLVAVGLASVATLFVYRAITRIPVRQVEVASVFVAVAPRISPGRGHWSTSSSSVGPPRAPCRKLVA